MEGHDIAQDESPPTALVRLLLSTTPFGDTMSERFLEKASAVLDALSVRQSPMSIPELASRVGLRPLSLRKILTQLEDADWIEIEDNTCKVGRRVRDWGLASIGVDTIVEKAETAMTRLHIHDAVGVRLALYDAPWIVVLKTLGVDYFETSLRIGARMQAHKRVDGMAVLSALPLELQQAYAVKYLSVWTVERVQADYFDTLGAFRDAGYAWTTPALKTRTLALGVPVFGVQRAPVGAITVLAPAEELEMSSLLSRAPQAIAAARSLSVELGCPESVLDRYWSSRLRSIS